MDFIHVPVAKDRVLQLVTPALATNQPEIFLDATLGLGGHAEMILANFPNVFLIGFDRDIAAIEIAEKRLAKYQGRFAVLHHRFDAITENLNELTDQGIISTNKISAALFDLGVSSLQLDNVSRGFSYHGDGPLDMRMNQSDELSAMQVVNSYSGKELANILRTFGEEKFASRIADYIVEKRATGPITSTAELAALVKEAIPAPARRQGGNPAKRTFQAIRIEVNQELQAIKAAIPQALENLKVSGRIVVLSYQSLEDKITKDIFQSVTKVERLRGLPVDLPESAAKFNLIMRSSEMASEAEIAENSRATSLRLRAIERVAA
jgi:16S rRNA (cytosine1402-N4)-methyltransferase